MEYRFNSETVSVGDKAVSPHTPTMFLGGGGFLLTENSKSQVQTNFSFGGRGTLDTTFLIYLSGGTQGILSTKFYKPKLGLASPIVSHTLHVWRLINYVYQ